MSDLVERSVLDLPIAHSAVATSTISEQWLVQIKKLQLVLPDVACQLVLDERAREPSSIDKNQNLAIRRDPQSYRGTGGLLSDLVGDRASNDFILVADAAQTLREDLSNLCEKMQSVDADVVLTADKRLRAGGVTLVRCAVLKHVPEMGFRDLKEQVLPGCRAKGYTVRVLKQDRLPGSPIRDATEYLSAVFQDAELPVHESSAADRFNLIEASAKVDPEAQVYRSIVLSGAIVERGARVIRSVVCPGVTIRAGERVADQIVGRLTRRKITAKQ